MKKIINEEIKRMQKLAGIILNEESVASDGGYYSDRDENIYVDQKEADYINNLIEYFRQNVVDGIQINKNKKSKIFLKIKDYLTKNGFSFENENEEGIDYFYLSPNQNIEDLNKELDLVYQIFYTKIIK